MYLRGASIALFRVDGMTICVKLGDENVLSVVGCYIHTGDIPQAKVKFVMTTQVARGNPNRPLPAPIGRARQNLDTRAQRAAPRLDNA